MKRVVEHAFCLEGLLRGDHKTHNFLPYVAAGLFCVPELKDRMTAVGVEYTNALGVELLQLAGDMVVEEHRLRLKQYPPLNS